MPQEFPLKNKDTDDTGDVASSSSSGETTIGAAKMSSNFSWNVNASSPGTHRHHTNTMRYRLFPPLKKSPKEELEILMGRAFYMSDKESVFEKIFKLLENCPNLRQYKSKQYDISPLDLAITLNHKIGGLEKVIPKLMNLGCLVSPNLKDYLPKPQSTSSIPPPRP